MYEQIPTILRPQELLDKALGRSSKIEKPDRDPMYRFRKTALARTESMRDILGETLDRYVKSFPNLDRVGTYERELVDVLVGVVPLRKTLARLSGAKRTVDEIALEGIQQMRRQRDQEKILRTRRWIVGRVADLIGELEEPLAFLAEARERFQRIPEVTPGDTTVVVAGYPNVGKSSLLAALSAARPEIAPYAYTTKQTNVGHFLDPGVDEVRARRFQLVDTPGLLEKPRQARNPIEKQAVLALTHLADIILFVIDPTETCGYTRGQQEGLLAEVRTDFEGVPILEVETKADLKNVDTPASDRLRVSCTEGDGIEELRSRIVDATPEDPFAKKLAEAELPARDDAAQNS